MFIPLFSKDGLATKGKTLLAAMAFLGSLMLGHATALSEIHPFPQYTGISPYSTLMQATDGNFYGTTYGLGPFCYGTLFKMTTNGTLTTLVTFNGFNGAHPRGGLIQANDGNLYGTTVNGGPWGPDAPGTIFKVTSNGVLTTMAYFKGSSHDDGANPLAPLIQATDGNFYGTTSRGGTNLGGTVFKMDTNGNVIILASFVANSSPYAGLVENTNGSFYGVSWNNGGNPKLFQITTNGQLSFLTANPTGAAYDGLVEGPDSDFGASFYYGTTYNGGTSSQGEIYKWALPLSFGQTFSFSGTNGSHPYAGLVQGQDGNFYGTTTAGGANGFGTIFVIMTNFNLTTLFSFNGTNGANPWGRLVFGKDGKLYGTTQAGGLYNAGTIFSVTTSGVFTNLVSFSGAAQASTLIQSGTGELFGATSCGGSNAFGSVFKLSTNGVIYTDLYDFRSTGGENPFAGLLLSSNGQLYGTTETGSILASDGTVFTVTTNGAFTNLYTFTTTGWRPEAPLLEYGGYLYGTCFWNGGLNGAIFQMTYRSQTTSSTSYGLFGTNGANPSSGLKIGADGNFYGTTEYGGTGFDSEIYPTGYGTVFSLTNFGSAPNVLVYFDGTNGANPYAGLISASDGNLYGTTLQGGAYNLGTAYEVTTNGTFTSLISFDSTNGATPFAGLIQGNDGQLYGTTFYGGSNNYGTIFRLQTNGTLETLYSFGTLQDTNGNAIDGGYPGTALLQTSDGDFYGTTSAGGSLNGGNIFRFVLRPTLRIAMQSGGSVLLTWDTIPGLTYQLQSANNLAPAQWSNAGSASVATNSSMSYIDSSTADSNRFYQVILLP